MSTTTLQTTQCLRTTSVRDFLNLPRPYYYTYRVLPCRTICCHCPCIFSWYSGDWLPHKGISCIHSDTKARSHKNAIILFANPRRTYPARPVVVVPLIILPFAVQQKWLLYQNWIAFRARASRSWHGVATVISVSMLRGKAHNDSHSGLLHFV